MATIGMLVPAAPGHLNPMNALGRALLRRGHRVVVVTLADGEPAVRAADLEFAPIGASDYPRGSIPQIFAELGRRRGLDAFRFTIRMGIEWMRTLLRDAPAALQPFEPDVLVIDQAMGGDAIAERMGLPFVNVANALFITADPDFPPGVTAWGPSRSPWALLRNRLTHGAVLGLARPVLRMTAEYRRAHGLRPKASVADWFSPLAQISQQPAELEFPARRPPHVHFVGPLTDPESRAPVPFPFEALDGDPLIYASLGTIQNRLLWIFRAIAGACEGRNARLVISLGGSADPSVLGELPGRPIVVRAAPQLDLLARASLTITHAGMNTTLESLSRGVPMVAIPITNDQPGVAARLGWSGAGLVVPPRRLTESRLRDAIDRVLKEPSFRENAERLRDAIARAGGLTRAAEIVERVLATGRPVLAEEFATAVTPEREEVRVTPGPGTGP